MYKAIHLLLVLLVLVGCSSSTEVDSVPGGHAPASTLTVGDLVSYQIAYCQRTTQLDEVGQGRTDIVLRQGDSSLRYTITVPITPPQSPVSLSCNGRNDAIRVGGLGLAWRPEHAQLSMTTAVSSASGDHFYFVDVGSDLVPTIPDIEHWEHQRLFRSPYHLSWSPDGKWLATDAVATNGDTGRPEIWIYSPESREGLQVTKSMQGDSAWGPSSWSPDGRFLAVTRASGYSGLALIDIQTLQRSDIGSENHDQLRNWPYAPSLLNLIAGASIEQILQEYIAQNSPPIWISDGQRVIFVAPSAGDQVSIFVSNRDGSSLTNLTAPLEGITGLPRLSPDNRTLAFVRYPGWGNRDRAEVGLYDFSTNTTTSLLVLAKPQNGDELFISGLDWSPDGHYLAFSSNHDGESDIYVVSADGTAWVSLTADTDGDAVYPLWRP